MDRDMDAIRKILFSVKQADQAVTNVDGVEDDVFTAIPDIPSRLVFMGCEGSGFRKLFGASA